MPIANAGIDVDATLAKLRAVKRDAQEAHQLEVEERGEFEQVRESLQFSLSLISKPPYRAESLLRRSNED